MLPVDQLPQALGSYEKGTYSCRFNYTGPVHIKKSARMLTDGRLWLGTVESNVTEITVGN